MARFCKVIDPWKVPPAKCVFPNLVDELLILILIDIQPLLVWGGGDLMTQTFLSDFLLISNFHIRLRTHKLKSKNRLLKYSTSVYHLRVSSIGGIFHWRVSSIWGYLPLEVIFHWGSPYIRGQFPLEVVFHYRSSFIEGHLPFEVIFHLMSSSISVRFPLKVVFHWKSSSIGSPLPLEILFH